MERDINFKFEDIYSNMEDKDEKHTKKLLDKPSSTSNIDPFFVVIFVIACFIVVVFSYLNSIYGCIKS